MGFKALAKKDAEETCFMAQYWVVYILLEFLEFFTDFLLFWIPMYYLLKMGVFYFLLSEKFRGAERVFAFLVPHLEKVSPTCDQVLESASAMVSNGVAAVAGSAAAAAGAGAAGEDKKE